MRGLKLMKWWAGALAVVFAFGACGDETTPVEPEEDNPPTIELTAPTGGEVVAPGSDLAITWTATDDNEVVGVDLFYSHGGGSGTIATDVTGSSYTWSVPNNQWFSVKVRAVAKDSADQTDEDESDIFGLIEASERGYAGSQSCKQCHSNYYRDLFEQSGHPFKLNKVVGDQAPEYPHSDVPMPPPGASRNQWSDIAYVIGGYGWKARFITRDSGWIMTAAPIGGGGDAAPTQYNLARPDLENTVGGMPTEWVDYHATDTERKSYNCGPCHMTGWEFFADNGGVNQDGLPGIGGTWEEPGVRCEQCHGPGADHMASLSTSDITVDETSDACGLCHRRNADDDIIDASGNFIKHHEQFQEWRRGTHFGFVQCIGCHDSHIGATYGNDVAGGIIQTCEDCHTRAVNHNGAPSCIDCHMPRATKSARKVHDFEGDVRTHIFGVNTGTETRADFFSVDLASVRMDKVTLDFACYSCHKDNVGGTNGQPASYRTMAELSARAMVIH